MLYERHQGVVYRFALFASGMRPAWLAGTAMLVLFGLTWIFYVYRHDPYVDVSPQLVRLRAWARA